MRINAFGYEVVFRHRRRQQFPKVVTPLDLQRWFDKVQQIEQLSTRTVNALKRAYARDPLLDINAIIAGKRLVRHIGPSARAELQAAIKEIDCDGLYGGKDMGVAQKRWLVISGGQVIPESVVSVSLNGATEPQ